MSDFFGPADREVRRRRWQWPLALGSLVAVGCLLLASLQRPAAGAKGEGGSEEDPQEERAAGRETFRFDTFGDEQQWTDKLRMHEVIESSISPVTALNLGLKVDVDALPDAVLGALASGDIDLTDPATTVALIKLNAVVGVVGKVKEIDGRDRLTQVGITCAVCHSTVDDSLAPGIGSRLDGWPNHDLDPGKIIAASPAVPDDAKAVYSSWGPGFYDPRFNIDSQNTPLVIPPAYGLAGIDLETYTGEGPISYWNNYVAVTQMGGHGTFIDPRLGIDIEQTPDRVTPKLSVLLKYQLSLPAPPPPADSFDPEAARRGAEVFAGAGKCATCHQPDMQYTDVNLGVLHDPAETGMDPLYAARTATGKYRTTPLRALWQHAPYFHDGSAATLLEVVEHYDSVLNLELTADETLDLVEFLKSL
jgi:mono/diheme cytochrome c family protein